MSDEAEKAFLERLEEVKRAIRKSWDRKMADKTRSPWPGVPLINGK